MMMMINGGATRNAAAAALMTAASTTSSGGRKKKNDVYHFSTAARATLALTAVVLLMSGMHYALQHSHRQLCSRNFINAVLFAHSETCVIMDGSMAFIEATCGYLIKTGVASGLCVIYGTCNKLVSGGSSNNSPYYRRRREDFENDASSSTTAPTAGGDNWTIARTLASSLSCGGYEGTTARRTGRCSPLQGGGGGGAFH